MTLTHILNKLIAHQDLSKEEVHSCVNLLLQDTDSAIQKGAVIAALKSKGETVEEVVACIESLRQRMISLNISNAIDVCGTGGDKSGTFNISTATAFVVAGAGVGVAKHGNRAVSSVCGSADVLEALGVQLVLTPQQAEEVFQSVGMVFLFAPMFHPSFKQVAQVRKELGIPTIFNMLGPFLNPARVKRQIIGVPTPEKASLLAHVATKLSYEHLCIVSSEDGLDEVSTTALSRIFEIKGTTISSFTIDPQSCGFSQASIRDLAGGNALENAHIIEDTLSGKPGPKQDIILLNSGLALYVSGKVQTIEEGIVLARNAITSGLAQRVLENLRKETRKYVQQR